MCITMWTPWSLLKIYKMMKDFLILERLHSNWLESCQRSGHKSSNKSQRKKCRKCWKQNRSAYRSKICDKFNTRKGEKIHDTPKKVGIRDTPKEDKGEELIKLLETQTETKNNTTKRVSKQIFSVVTTRNGVTHILRTEFVDTAI